MSWNGKEEKLGKTRYTEIESGGRGGRRLTRLVAGCRSRLGEMMTSWLVETEPTGVDCGSKGNQSEAQNRKTKQTKKTASNQRQKKKEKHIHHQKLEVKSKPIDEETAPRATRNGREKKTTKTKDGEKVERSRLLYAVCEREKKPKIEKKKPTKTKDNRRPTS